MKKGTNCVSIQFLERIAHRRRGFVEIFGAPDDLELIAKLQAQTWHRRHLDICAAHARDGDAETIVEVEFVNGFAEHVAIGHGNASKSDVAFGED